VDKKEKFDLWEIDNKSANWILHKKIFPKKAVGRLISVKTMLRLRSPPYQTGVTVRV